ncbi:hypothetical protein LTS18_001560, partial [Coniosporium uncinatum]
MAPIAASTQAKTKLKAFHFIEGRPERPPVDRILEDTENIAPGAAEDIAAEDVLKPSKPASQTQTLPQPKTFPPSTPATRLPLADLIGNADDSNRRTTALAKTPEEHLTWVTNPGSSQRKAATPARRGTKRARSSSPLSSQQEKETFDFQHLHQSLRTPQADPAADLWSTYAADASRQEAAVGGKNVAFAHLIENSSPRSSASAGSVGGLRRWASCGVEWPTSEKKRRRTNGTLRASKKDGQIQEASRENDEVSRKSRIGMLVEQLEVLSKPAGRGAPSAPSSSSPLPETKGPREDPHNSPLERLTPVAENPEEQPAQSQASAQSTSRSPQ